MGDNGVLIESSDGTIKMWNLLGIATDSFFVKSFFSSLRNSEKQRGLNFVDLGRHLFFALSPVSFFKIGVIWRLITTSLFLVPPRRERKKPLSSSSSHPFFFGKWAPSVRTLDEFSKTATKSELPMITRVQLSPREISLEFALDSFFFQVANWVSRVWAWCMIF